MTGSRMFPFITCTWNPLGGECKHNCEYCWAQALIERNKFAKYQGESRLCEKELKRLFKPGDFVFACDMLDWLGECDRQFELGGLEANHITVYRKTLREAWNI